MIIRTTGPFSRKTRSLELRTLAEVELSEGRNGGGSISFGRANPLSSFGFSGWPGYGAYAAPSFELEKGARDVHEIILKAQQVALHSQ